MNQKTGKYPPKKRKKLSFLLLPLVFCLLIFTTGCVKYEVGINFPGQQGGLLVQQIKLDQDFTDFSPQETQEWLKSIETRAKNLQGKVKHISEQEILVKIPFGNGKELASKFNSFFNPNLQQGIPPQQEQSQALDPLPSHLDIKQNNLLLVERNKLSFDFDLSSLGTLSQEPKVTAIPNYIFDLELTLNTSWGAKVVAENNQLGSEISQNEHQLVWKLQPGQENHLEAVFWSPSYLGFGTLIIALIIVGSFYYKYQRFPWQKA